MELSGRLVKRTQRKGKPRSLSPFGCLGYSNHIAHEVSQRHVNLTSDFAFHFDSSCLHFCKIMENIY